MVFSTFDVGFGRGCLRRLGSFKYWVGALCSCGYNEPLLHALFAVVVLWIPNGIDGRSTLGDHGDVALNIFASNVRLLPLLPPLGVFLMR